MTRAATPIAAPLCDALDPASGTVLPGIASAPAPVLTVAPDAATAVLAGVRFAQAIECWHCRRQSYVYRDGGTVTVGLHTSHSGKTVRWTLAERCARPVAPAACPHCAHPAPSNGWHGHSLMPIHPQVTTLMGQAYDAIRGRHPELAARADAAHR